MLCQIKLLTLLPLALLPLLSLSLSLSLSMSMSLAQSDAQQTLRINSPRKESGDAASSSSSSSSSSETLSSGENGDGVKLVKLPSDLRAVLDLQRADRSRIHASILGLQPGASGNGQTNLADILNEVSPPSSTEKSSTGRPTSTSLATPETTRSGGDDDGDGGGRNKNGRRRDGGGRKRKNKNRKEQQLTIDRVQEFTTSSTTSSPSPSFPPGYPAQDAPLPDAEQTPSERSIWWLTWEAHVYFSGTLFILLALYCTVNILRLHTFSRLFSRGYFVGLNLCIVVVGVLRPLYLFIDPYNASGSLPRVAAYVLLDTGFPCVTTAFAILFLALLRATQIELVSPSFQTPRSLGIFCLIHLAISLSVDVAVGLTPSVKYLILICQGFFIVWSLLLSAGYFYIFSAMKKISLRTGTDLLRSYPKLVLDGAANGFPHSGDTGVAVPGSGRPPLCRAVHLTLGVAVLGSLMGGVQLFGMIKMLGLQKADMSGHHNESAWYGYQLSMRVLELALCTLLAVIATTPLRSEPPNQQIYAGYDQYGNPIMAPPAASSHASSSCCPFSSCINCCQDNPPVEFEDEIYSEICSNNHTVRHMQHPGENPYGTLGRMGGIQAGELAHQQQLMQMGTLSTGHHYPPMHQQGPPSSTASNQNLLLFNLPSQQQTSMGGGGNPTRNSDSASNPNSTLRATGSSSRATMESALYSNLAATANSNGSRPSSMLFNDAGFVRFRMGGDPGRMVDEVLRQSTDDLAQGANAGEEQLGGSRRGFRMGEGLRASQSFDETVLFDGGRSPTSASVGVRLSPLSPQEVKDAGIRQKRSSGGRTSADSKNKLTRQSPIYKSIDSLKSEEDEAASAVPIIEEDLYEPPPGMKLPPVPVAAGGASNKGIYSESEYDPTYSGVGGGRSQQQIYNSSRCSSISATQSFDMRMYGIVPPGPSSQQSAASSGGAGAGAAFATTTLKRNEEHKEKLENPYYYYGSTRNQKKQKQIQKPRPLLPSQRSQLEAAKKGLIGLASSGGGISRPQSRQQQQQQLQQQIQQQQQQQQQHEMNSVIPAQFQRSRSLGGYYNNKGQQPQELTQPAPIRNQHLRQQPQLRQQQIAGGSMTPLSYSRWQHAQQQEAGPRRYNPLYDTPPTARANARMAENHHQQGMLGQRQQHPNFLHQRSEPGQAFRMQQQQQNLHQHPRFFMPEIRGVTGPQLQQQQLQQRQQHPHHQQLLSPILTDPEGSPMRHNLLSEDDFDYEDEDSDPDGDQFTSQATQGYSEGLADCESEVSSLHQDNRVRKTDLHLVSPLEYSAMMKLYGGDSSKFGAAVPKQKQNKDVTPDSGVVNSDSNKSRKSQQQEESVKAKKVPAAAAGKKYTRVNTDEGDADGQNSGTNNGLFSSSSEESECEMPQAGAEKRYRPLAARGSPDQVKSAGGGGFRWDGSAVGGGGGVRPMPAPRRRSSTDGTDATDDVEEGESFEEDNDGDVSGEDASVAGRKVVDVCKEIQSADFGDKTAAAKA